MSPTGFHLLTLVMGTLTLALSAQILVWRFSAHSKRGAYKLLALIFLGGFFAGIGIYAGLFEATPTEKLLGGLVFTLAYGGLATAYLFSYVGVEHESPSSKILLAIRRRPEGLSREELLRTPSGEDPRTLRLETMIETGWLETRDGKPVLTRKGRLATLFFSLPSTLVRHCAGGRG